MGKEFLPPGAKYIEPGNPAAGYYFPAQEDDPATTGTTPQAIIAAESARLAAIKAVGTTPSPPPLPAPAPVTRDVRVTIDLAGRSSALYESQFDVDSFLRSLDAAKRSEGMGLTTMPSLTVSIKSWHYTHLFILHMRNDGCKPTV